MVFIPHFVIPLVRYTVITTSLRVISGEKMGDMGNMGLMGSKITKYSSEKNQISSTLFKISSEQKKLSPSYLPLFQR